MKIKIEFLTLLLFITGAVAFISCEKNEDNNEDKPTNSTPQIELISPDANEITVETWENIAFDMNISSENGSDEKITDFSLTRKFEQQPIEIVFNIQPDTTYYSLINYSLKANTEAGTEVFTFTATDESGDLSELIVTVITEGDPPDFNPNISFLSGIEPTTGMLRIHNDTTLEKGSNFVFGFNAIANNLTGENLTNILVTRNFNNLGATTIMDTTLNSSSFVADIQSVTYSGSTGDELFEVTAKDNLGNASSISFTITTIEGDPGIYIYEDIQLGSFQSNIGSQFSTADGLVYSPSQTNSNETLQQKINWVYFHGATYGHTLMSPANDFLYSVYPSIESWTYKNYTYFSKTSITAVTFEQIANIQQLIIQISFSGVTFDSDFVSENMSNPIGFSQGDVFAFKLDGSGEEGLILIKSVNAGATYGESTITYDVKLEK